MDSHGSFTKVYNIYSCSLACFHIAEWESKEFNRGKESKGSEVKILNVMVEVEGGKGKSKLVNIVHFAEG